jgi:hypothetical protein
VKISEILCRNRKRVYLDCNTAQKYCIRLLLRTPKKQISIFSEKLSYCVTCDVCVHAKDWPKDTEKSNIYFSEKLSFCVMFVSTLRIGLRLILSVDTNATHSPKAKKVKCVACVTKFVLNTMCLPPKALPYTGQKQKQKWIISPKFTHICGFHPPYTNKNKNNSDFIFVGPPTDNISSYQFHFCWLSWSTKMKTILKIPRPSQVFRITHIFHLTNVISRIFVFYYKDGRNKNDRQICVSELFLLKELSYKGGP